MTDAPLYHLVAPNGSFLAAFRAASDEQALGLAVTTLRAMDRQRGRVRLVDSKRTRRWESTISLHKMP
jgi:hypothetical protein